MVISVVNSAALGALESDWRRREEVLTAEFFGLLRYLQAETLLLPLLSAGESWDELATFEEWWSRSEGLKQADYQLEWEAGYERPDVRIRLRDGDDHLVLFVVVEVKLHSSQSQRAGSDASQLLRYLRATARDGEGRKRALVYLTADRTPPVDDLLGARDQAEKDGLDHMGLFWLSWYKAAEVLAQVIRAYQGGDLEKQVLQDLEIVLQKRGFWSAGQLKPFPLEFGIPLNGQGSSSFRTKGEVVPMNHADSVVSLKLALEQVRVYIESCNGVLDVFEDAMLRAGGRAYDGATASASRHQVIERLVAGRTKSLYAVWSSGEGAEKDCSYIYLGHRIESDNTGASRLVWQIFFARPDGSFGASWNHDWEKMFSEHFKVDETQLRETMDLQKIIGGGLLLVRGVELEDLDSTERLRNELVEPVLAALSNG